MDTRRIVRQAILSALLWMPVLAPACSTAQETPPAVKSGNPFASLMPGLAAAPAPDWVKPGVLLTYDTASGQSTSRFPLLGDEPIPKDQPDSLEGFPNTGGKGYTMLQVVALSGKVAAIRIRSYTVISQLGGPLIAGGSGMIQPAGAALDTWLNPQEMQKAVGKTGEGAIVSRGPYVLNGKTYPAVIFLYKGPHSRVSCTNEEATGRLLVSTVQTETQDPINHTWRCSLAQARFRSVRQMEVPWDRPALPEWIKPGEGLAYEGQKSTPARIGPDLVMEMTLQAQVQQKGADWFLCRLSSEQRSANGAAQSGTGTHICGWADIYPGNPWMPSEGLKKLHAGQVLDRDPALDETITVKEAGERGGRAVVVISRVNRLQRADYVYDRDTGLLLGWSSQDGPPTNATTKMTLKVDE